MRRGLSALIVVDALAGFAALLAILIYFLARREEEAEFVLLVVLLVVCCANAVVVAIFRRETGDHLQAQEQIREELAAIRGMLEKDAGKADMPVPEARRMHADQGAGASSSIASPKGSLTG